MELSCLHVNVIFSGKQFKYTVDVGGKIKLEWDSTFRLYVVETFSHGDSFHSAFGLCIQLSATGSRDFDPPAHVPFQISRSPSRLWKQHAENRKAALRVLVGDLAAAPQAVSNEQSSTLDINGGSHLPSEAAGWRVRGLALRTSYCTVGGKYLLGSWIYECKALDWSLNYSEKAVCEKLFVLSVFLSKHGRLRERSPCMYTVFDSIHGFP